MPPKKTTLKSGAVNGTITGILLSMVSVKLEWVVVEKKVHNVDTQKTEYIRFLRLNVIHKYNHTMGHVDVACYFL
jgi:hypothetical protein